MNKSFSEQYKETSSVCIPLSISPVCPNGFSGQQDKVCPEVHHPIGWTMDKVQNSQNGQVFIKDKSFFIKKEDTHYIDEKRKELLETFRKKQPFRVAIGKSQWVPYESFNLAYNLREILDDEVVIEFDCTVKETVIQAIQKTERALQRAGIIFEHWEHGGKSPHIHIHNIPIKNIDGSKRALFKKIFIRKYVPKEYLPFVDLSLTGIHLIALEWARHWKGIYGVKKIIRETEGKEISKDLKVNYDSRCSYCYSSRTEECGLSLVCLECKEKTPLHLIVGVMRK